MVNRTTRFLRLFMFFLPWEGEDEITRRTVRVGPRLASPKAGRSPICFWRLAKTRLCSTAMISPRCRLGVKTRIHHLGRYVSFHRQRTCQTFGTDGEGRVRCWPRVSTESSPWWIIHRSTDGRSNVQPATLNSSYIDGSMPRQVINAGVAK